MNIENIIFLLGDTNVELPSEMNIKTVSRLNRSLGDSGLVKYIIIAVLLLEIIGDIVKVLNGQIILSSMVIRATCIVFLFLMFIFLKLYLGDTIIINDEEIVEANWLGVKHIKWDHVAEVIVFDIGSNKYVSDASFLHALRTVMRVIGNGEVIDIKNNYSDIGSLINTIKYKTSDIIKYKHIDIKGLVVFVLSVTVGILMAIYAPFLIKQLSAR